MSGNAFISTPQRPPTGAGISQPLSAPGYAAHPPVRPTDVNLQQAGTQQYRTQQTVTQYPARTGTTPAPQHQYGQQPRYPVKLVTTLAPYPQQQQQQQQQQQEQQYAIVQANTGVKITDLNKERPRTAEEIRKANSQYFIFRWTKADKSNGYDSDGRKRKPNWKHAVRFEVPGFSYEQAAQLVRKLNTTGAVVDKKLSLSTDEQLHIELALRELQTQHDNAWFETTLVQLDDQIVEKPRDKPKDKHNDKDSRERQRRRETGKEKDRRKETHRKAYTLKSKDTQKRTDMERVSLTAYFRRAPRSNIDPVALLNQQSTQMQAMQQKQQQAYDQQAVDRPDAGLYLPAPQNMPPRVIHAPPGGIKAGYHTQAYPHNSSMAIVQPASRRRPRTPNRRPFYRSRHSPPSTDESVGSDGFSSPGDDDGYDSTNCTSPASSSYISSRGSYERLQRRSQSQDRPAYYGIPNKSNPARPPVHMQPHPPNNVRGGAHPQVLPQPRPGAGPGPAIPPGVVPPPPGRPLQNNQIPHPPLGHPSHNIPAGQPPIPSHLIPPAPPPLIIPNHGGQPQPHPHPQPPPGMPMPMPLPGQNPHMSHPPAGNAIHGNGMNMNGVPGAVDPKQIYANAYAAGRADSRQEALTMAERVAERAAAAAAAASAANAPPVVVQTQRGGGGGGGRNRSRSRSHSRDRDGDGDSWGRSRSSSRSRSRSRSPPRDREYHDRRGGRDRGRSLSLDRDRRGRGFRRGRSVSFERRGGGGGYRGREYERGHGGRDRSRDGGRYRDWSRPREHRDRDRSHSRSRNRSPDRNRGRVRPGSPHRCQPPPSGVRLFKPANGFIRPRVNMDREGLERGMDGLRLSDDRQETYGQRQTGLYGKNNRAFSSREERRETGHRDADRVRRDEEKMIREEMARRERERGARDQQAQGARYDFAPRRKESAAVPPVRLNDAAAFATTGNPFAPRQQQGPGPVRHTGTANLTGQENEFITL